MSRITQKRIEYKPFLYPEAFQFWLRQQQAHWLATEVPLNQDVSDWEWELSDSEKSVIGGILKGFTQTEIVVNDYWSNKVTKWFPHPEIVMAATSMAAMETIHTHAYSLLDETLGFDDYTEFLTEPSVKNKLDRLVNLPGETLEEIALSLAVFSAFTEGVSLFSSFAILAHFSRENKMKGMSQLVTWSARDESLHAEFGCYLFRTLMRENPHLWTDELKKEIYQAARDTISLEDSVLDKVFELGNLEDLKKEDLKAFARYRANNQLGKLGLKMNWKSIDKDALDRMSWFDSLMGGPRHDDFFAIKPTDYSKGVISFDTDMF